MSSISRSIDLVLGHIWAQLLVMLVVYFFVLSRRCQLWVVSAVGECGPTGNLMRIEDLARSWPDVDRARSALGLGDKLVRSLVELSVASRENGGFLVTIVADRETGVAVESQLCSFRQCAFPMDNLVYICLDATIALRVCSFGVHYLLLPPLNLTLTERHSLKLLVPLLVLLTDTMCMVVDSDVIFLDRFDKLWEWTDDMEIASDSPVDVAVGALRIDRQHEVNTGLIRYSPRKPVVRFLVRCLDLALSSRKWRDQAVVNSFLRKARKTGAVWFVPEFGFTFSIIDPVKAPNGGLLFCQGRWKLQELARRRNITSPITVHLNYHLPVLAKVATLNGLGWNLVQGKCPKFKWGYWKSGSWPALTCKGRYVRV